MKVVLTGGGSAGHVTPNIAIAEQLRDRGDVVSYIGSHHEMDATLVRDAGLPLTQIASGKLRRYFDWQNFIDPFRILLGILQALAALRRLRPEVIFSKGGFVAVPVVVAAWILRIPVIVHESDVTPGLANRLCFPLAARICINFEATRGMIPQRFLRAGRVSHTGTPLRKALRDASGDRGRRFLNLNDDPVKPLLLIFGGSLGAERINALVFEVIDQLLEGWTVVHVVGKKDFPRAPKAENYFVYDYVGDAFGDLLAAADVVVSRAGANALYELLAFKKPHLLIPLGAKASRGDQIENANLFRDQGWSDVLFEQDASPSALIQAINELWAMRAQRIQNLARVEIGDGTGAVIKIIDEVASNKV